MTSYSKEKASQMNFVISRKKPTKNRPKLDWKIKLRSYKKEHLEEARLKNPNHKSKSVEIVVPENEWFRYGFNEEMSYEQARLRVTQLNDKKKLDDEKSARLTLIKRSQNEELIDSAYLPIQFVEEFEERLHREFKKRKRSMEFCKWKKMSHWRKSKQIIRDLNIDPEAWVMEKDRFYSGSRNLMVGDS